MDLDDDDDDDDDYDYDDDDDNSRGWLLFIHIMYTIRRVTDGDIGTLSPNTVGLPLVIRMFVIFVLLAYLKNHRSKLKFGQ